QLYEGLLSAIIDGTLRAGQRLPSSRGLACELGISRITVLNAYGQLLAEGYLQSRVGSGTVVCRSLPEQIAISKPHSLNRVKTRLGARRLAKRARLLDSVSLSHASLTGNAQWRRGWGAFAVGQVAFDDFPFKVWNGLLMRHCRSAGRKSLDYGHPMGSHALREAISTYLRTARGARCQADQIMIVSGSQQALEIAARVLLDPGDRVWFEEPGYRLARNVFAFHGCLVVPVPVDG